MDQHDDRQSKSMTWWIASLAASSLICTAFAGYLFDIKADLNNSKIRDDIIEQRLDILSEQLDNMRRHAIVEQMQIAPPDGTIQVPTTVVVSPSVTPSSAPVVVPPAVPAPPPAAAVPPVPTMPPSAPKPAPTAPEKP